MAQQEFTDFEVAIEGLEEMQAWGGEGGQLAQPGPYEMRVANVKQDTAKSSGNPMIVVTFEITKCLEPETQAPENVGCKVYNNYVLTDKAMPRLKQLMVACGASLGGFKASEIFGQTIKATVIHTEQAGTVDQNGNPRPPRTFANLMNEEPVVEASATSAKTSKTATKPPITNAAGAAKTTNGAARRA